MAITTTAQVLYDGLRNVTMQFTGTGDGGGDEINALKVDCSALNPPCKSVAIKRIDYDVGYGVVEMLWDADIPVPFLELTESGFPLDYKRINGLVNGGGPSANGNILFSTKGFELKSTYSIVLEMRKKDKL